MRLRALVLLSILAIGLLAIGATPARAGDGYQQIGTVAIPGFNSFDIGWVDSASHTYYIAERTSLPNQGRVHVIDADTDTLLGTVGQFVGNQGPGRSGPNGILVIHKLHQLWAGDGDSHLKAYDLISGERIADVDLGGKKRADELAYDPRHKVILVANDADNPPFISLVSTEDMSITHVDFPQATDGIEQPVYDRAGSQFLLAVPSTTDNPGGEIDAIDPISGETTRIYALTDCVPHGLVLGPRHRALIGCSKERTLVMDVDGGDIVANLTQVGGSDEVWYNRGDHRYYTASSNHVENGVPTPVFGVISACSNSWITNVPTKAGAHSIAVNPRNGHIFVPVNGEGVRVYAQTEDADDACQGVADSEPAGDD